MTMPRSRNAMLDASLIEILSNQGASTLIDLNTALDDNEHHRGSFVRADILSSLTRLIDQKLVVSVHSSGRLFHYRIA